MLQAHNWICNKQPMFYFWLQNAKGIEHMIFAGSTYVENTTEKILLISNICSNMSHLLTFGVIEVGKVCWVSACPDSYRGSTYVCIMCTSSTYVIWSTYILCRLNNIEGNMLYYRRRLRKNLPADRFWWPCKKEHTVWLKKIATFQPHT